MTGAHPPLNLCPLGAQGLNSLIKWTCVRVLSHFSHVRLSATLWTKACQAPLSMRFFRHEYWSGLPFPTPGDFPDPGIKLASLMSPAQAGGFLTTAKSLQLCPTLCNPIDSSPQGSPVPGILQARTLEWVAISFSNAWKWKVKVKLLSQPTN